MGHTKKIFKKKLLVNNNKQQIAVTQIVDKHMKEWTKDRVGSSNVITLRPGETGNIN